MYRGAGEERRAQNGPAGSPGLPAERLKLHLFIISIGVIIIIIIVIIIVIILVIVIVTKYIS